MNMPTWCTDGAKIKRKPSGYVCTVERTAPPDATHPRGSALVRDAHAGATFWVSSTTLHRDWMDARGK